MIDRAMPPIGFWTWCYNSPDEHIFLRFVTSKFRGSHALTAVHDWGRLESCSLSWLVAFTSLLCWSKMVPRILKAGRLLRNWPTVSATLVAGELSPQIFEWIFPAVRKKKIVVQKSSAGNVQEISVAQCLGCVPFTTQAPDWPILFRPTHFRQ